MGILDSILGSGDVVKKGMKLLDDAFYTDAEKAEDKAKAELLKSEHKIDLLKAYAPFKVAQRYIAITFLILYSISYIGVLVATVLGYDTKEYLDAVETFNMQWTMMTIVMFYFGGGLVDSVSRTKNKNSTPAGNGDKLGK